MSLVNNQITATSRQLRHLRISFSIVYTIFASEGEFILAAEPQPFMVLFILFFLRTIKGYAYGSAASAFAARSLKKKQNDKIFIQPFVDDAKCGECHINMYTNVKMYLDDDRLHLENHRSASGNNTRLSQWRIQGGGGGFQPPPPSNKSSTYINIRFSRLVNVTIWLLIEWFRSV